MPAGGGAQVHQEHVVPPPRPGSRAPLSLLLLVLVFWWAPPLAGRRPGPHALDQLAHVPESTEMNCSTGSEDAGNSRQPLVPGRPCTQTLKRRDALVDLVAKQVRVHHEHAVTSAGRRLLRQAPIAARLSGHQPGSPSCRPGHTVSASLVR